MYRAKISYCHNCGTKLEENTMFCGECGCRIYDSEPESRRVSIGRDTIATGIVLLLLSILEVVYILPLNF